MHTTEAVAAAVNNTTTEKDENSECCQTISSDLIIKYDIALVMAVLLMSVIIFIGSIGNILVIIAVRTTKKLQTASNAFVVNLSVCDLVFVIIILPFNIYTYLADGWNLPILLCKIIGFLGYTLTGTTIITITMIAWNRYKLVVDPQNYQHLFNRCHLTIMLILTWVMPVACLMPAVLEVWGRFGYVTMMVTCNLLLDHDSQSFKLFLLIVRAVIPCALILYYYISIYRTTKASHRRVLSRRLLSTGLGGRQADASYQRREMHLTKMMATIFIVFALSYFPCTISSIVDWNTVLSKRFHMFCLITVYVGSAVNPLIYGLMNSQFRCAYYSILLCQCCSYTNEMLPTSSPSYSRKSLSRGSRQRDPNSRGQSARRLPDMQNLPTIYLPIDPSPSPRDSSDNPNYSPASLRDSSNDPKYSPATMPSKTSILKYRKLSIDSDNSTRSSQDAERQFDSLRRSETEKTYLENSP
ncbi:G-protein coupled receptor moody-like [Babylonia areolata]|uniref:G-protein coupled receptor moody-like n=1 Tax=Babylonia areolata TaxID=304850 RepID=UPI003FD55872